ncbi:protein-disulfide reductase DsbD family protein, partial [Capnocytophaga gingivalis]
NIDPEILNNISTNVWLNVIFFVIFVIFAFSFFGFYEITLPASWGNKMDNASNVGGMIGIFFMALTLAIVSFSCTGPILGSLLAGSLSSGGAIQLTLGMAGFGLSLALPFVLFALFPSWLNSLPKSGGWMTTAKVFLGFLELAFALKFLSNADLVQHWGLLKREVFVGLWFVLFALLTLYLFGLIRFPHDEPRKPLLQYSKGRLLIGVLSAAFSIYLLLGLFGKNSLRVLSGFPPPESYAFFPNEHKNDQIVFKDYYEGMAYAKEHNMPVMLDFTGWACVNCRKMEEHVWTDPQVKELMKKYVLISLYVDDKEELPKDKQFDFKHRNGRVEYIKTIGDKWATFQEVNFSSASQPYYVLLSPNTELLSTPVQYVDVETYKEWLRKGVKND